MTSSNSLYSRFNAVNAGVLFLMLVTDVASLITTPTRTTSTALRLSSEVVTAEAAEKSSESSSSSNSFVKPPRLIPDDPSLIPSLYNYDHCPFCVRVRLALGFKNIKHNLVFMANDDIHTPTAMVGKKIAPIMRFPSDNSDDEDMLMMESMDIIEFIENDERFGPTNVLKPASGRTDLKEWQNSVKFLLRTLQRPRYVATGLLPEFQQLDSRHGFIAKHPLPPFDKAEWKEMEDFSQKLSIYAEAMANDPTVMIEELNAKLVALDDIVYCDTYCTKGGLSLDDIDLWARLRSISIVADVQWPDGLRRYMDNLAELSDVSLYDGLAI
uniref:GST N-terminal domain-containing protein n=2 Tax=Pseudo-nitzschia australis TaxID=44445 RepID=A0A7S4AN15_9STRA|mmetsp:Transcript_6642/g.14145  ORF Transcript_6642/g.14145 Transcript_6642/m.14145 type:complete len:326 (-) Transcript_6642:496-1473(-)|eukprot:CAMPEP_0168191784 /NCGR_PEP_ID=MMETSP0139_2-20121125/17701_1 /TAXON_ID=44445 /ORGANISM="Pseudo-nitzschia australis, Strain 10249 10 AB" /LENGTH=325 /DNA_ID=CAMNT_0008114983 /DNA_START=102 /DNA_END=1079 /DNA_ORIENTATION=+